MMTGGVFYVCQKCMNKKGDKKMKLKNIFCLILAFFLLVVCCSGCSCFDSHRFAKTFENGEQLQFVHCNSSSAYADEKQDGYALCGQIAENLPEVFYIPSHFKNKEVVRTGALCKERLTIHKPFLIRCFAPRFQGCEVVYYPYACSVPKFNSYGKKDVGDYTGIIEYHNGSFVTTFSHVKKQFYTNNSVKNDGNKSELSYFLRWNLIMPFEQVYISEQLYNYFVQELDSYEELPDDIESAYFYTGTGWYKSWEEIYQKINNYCFTISKEKTESSKEGVRNIFLTIQKANINFIFNYNESPNQNVFLIDNHEAGEKVMQPPYEPIREGYTFSGWYKEAECINKWDFENDVMPEFRYDENDERIFEIIYLYAKWDKN